jgi:hypothetical protein
MLYQSSIFNEKKWHIYDDIESLKVQLTQEKYSYSKEKFKFIVKAIYDDGKELCSPGSIIFKEDLDSKSHMLEVLIFELIKLKYILKGYGFSPDVIKKLDFELEKSINLLKSNISKP